jgi:ferredoxin
VLDIFGDGPDTRLCCQLRVVADVPRVTLRVVDP